MDLSRNSDDEEEDELDATPEPVVEADVAMEETEAEEEEEEEEEEVEVLEQSPSPEPEELETTSRPPHNPLEREASPQEPQIPDEREEQDAGDVGHKDVHMVEDNSEVPEEETDEPEAPARVTSEPPASGQEVVQPLTPLTNGSPTNGVSFAQPDAVMEEEEELAEPSGYRDEIQSSGATGEATLRFDYQRLQQRYAARRESRTVSGPRNAYARLRAGAVTNAAGVANRDAEAAEAALSRVISKADFGRMEVLGQFNKGFIIARLRHSAEDEDEDDASDDLFIIDQHASDEKFNFETLQRTTVIKAQTLIRYAFSPFR